MQMMRARCSECNWEYDVIALPIPAQAIKSVGKAPCPMCGNVKANTLSTPRALTEWEAEHKRQLIG